ncbi:MULTISPECIES: GerMN domain-containing protein [unclassified Blastococcus]
MTVAPAALGRRAGVAAWPKWLPRLLVVEDDDPIRTALRWALEDEGYAVDEAVSEVPASLRAVVESGSAGRAFLDSAEGPYGLLSPSSSPSAQPPSEATEQRAELYLLGPDDVLVPSPREVRGAGLCDRLGDRLGQLAAGPTADERARQLTTVLAPGVRLAVTAVDQGTVTVDLTGPGETPDGSESRLAVAQIVLTAGTLPEVRGVLLTHDGEPLETPLPTGELTTRPVTAADYQELLVAPPS